MWLFVGLCRSMRFNIIGFGNSNSKEHKHCIIHPGVRLVQDLQDPDKLFCPTCGYSYLPKDSVPDDVYKSRFGPQQTRIITPKPKKKYYDKAGNEINDPDLIAEAQRGANVISYQEILPPDNNSALNTKNKKIPR